MLFNELSAMFKQRLLPTVGHGTLENTKVASDDISEASPRSLARRISDVSEAILSHLRRSKRTIRTNADTKLPIAAPAPTTTRIIPTNALIPNPIDPAIDPSLLRFLSLFIAISNDAALALLQHSYQVQQFALISFLGDFHVILVPDIDGMHLATNYDNAGAHTTINNNNNELEFTTALLPWSFARHLHSFTLIIPTHHGWLSDHALSLHQTSRFPSTTSLPRHAEPTEHHHDTWFSSAVGRESRARQEHALMTANRVAALCRHLDLDVLRHMEVHFQEERDGFGGAVGADWQLVRGVRAEFAACGEEMVVRAVERATVVGGWSVGCRL